LHSLRNFRCVNSTTRLGLRSSEIFYGDVSLLNFAVLGSLDDFASNLEILFEDGDPGFTSASFRVERQEFHVRAGHGEDIAGALLSNVGHLIVGGTSSRSGSGGDEGGHVHGALSSRAGRILSGFDIGVNHAERLGFGFSLENDINDSRFVITVISLLVDLAADLDILLKHGDLHGRIAGCGIILVEASLGGSAFHGELRVRAVFGDISYLVVGASGLTSGRGHRAVRSAGVARA